MKLCIQDAVDLAYGAGLLGTGGGGSPWIGQLALQQLLATGASVDVIDAMSLSDSATVATVAMIGAPTVMTEKLMRGDEMRLALELLEQVLDRPVDALMPVEIGGLNSTIALVAAGTLGLPVVDADGMGRAFPEVQMVTFGIAGVSAAPMVLVNEHGDHVLVQSVDNQRMERLARSVCDAMGGVAHAASYVMTGAEVKAHAIHGTLRMAIGLGRCAREARAQGGDVLQAIRDYLAGTGIYGGSTLLFEGRIADLDREVQAGFNIGTARLENNTGQVMEVLFRNENLLARVGGQVRAIVPDLICILDSESGAPITTDGLRYGQRVTVLGIGAPAALLTQKALAVVGPAGFGLQASYQPLTVDAIPPQPSDTRS